MPSALFLWRRRRVRFDVCRIQIGTPLLGEFFALFVTPLLYVRMMSRKQHVRDFLPLPDFGAGIVRIFEKSAVNALLLEANVIGKNSLAHSCY